MAQRDNIARASHWLAQTDSLTYSRLRIALPQPLQRANAKQLLGHAMPNLPDWLTSVVQCVLAVDRDGVPVALSAQ